MSRHLIVSKFKEDVSWLEQVSPGWEIVVYSKDPDETDKTFRRLPNLGREAHTYLYYILDNYETLPDLMVFTQGNPFDHSPNFLERLNGVLSENEYEPLSDHDFFFDELGNPHLTGNPPTNYGMYFKDFYQHLLGRSCPPLNYCFGNALFSVPKNKVVARPKEFYERCFDTITCLENKPGGSRVGLNIMEAHFFERLWHEIFSEDGISIDPKKFEAVKFFLEYSQDAARKGDRKTANSWLIKANEALRK